MKNSNPVCIRVNNRAEKLAALHLLSKAMDQPINECTLNSTLENWNVKDYPYVASLDGEIVGYACVRDTLIEYSDKLTPESIKEKISGKLEYRTSDDIQTVVNLKDRSVKIGAYRLTEGDLQAILSIMNRG